jgi:hypothetical protein
MYICKPFPPVETVGERTEMYDHSFESKHRHDVGNSKQTYESWDITLFPAPLVNMGSTSLAPVFMTSPWLMWEIVIGCWWGPCPGCNLLFTSLLQSSLLISHNCSNYFIATWAKSRYSYFHGTSPLSVSLHFDLIHCGTEVNDALYVTFIGKFLTSERIILPFFTSCYVR